MIAEIRDLYAYNRWANQRITDVVALLDDDAFTRHLGGSFPSVHLTLAHMVESEWIWLCRWEGTSPTEMPEGWDISTLPLLRTRWDAVEERRQGFLADLSNDALERPFEYRTFAGVPHTNTYGETLRHVVNHSSYHRGQVVTMLRQLGAEAVSTDLIRYYREQA